MAPRLRRSRTAGPFARLREGCRSGRLPSPPLRHLSASAHERKFVNRTQWHHDWRRIAELARAEPGSYQALLRERATRIELAFSAWEAANACCDDLPDYTFALVRGGFCLT